MGRTGQEPRERHGICRLAETRKGRKTNQPCHDKFLHLICPVR
ncbi:hypothetical protein SAMCFNEI73_Ch3149 [Sinorhizobium americanum]|uniref:Uncharacterized protein n=1 Tax=Sinorhizobium americanum TaxID=194963 RepID=A0A1L3LQV7_9HYPH|nr:hypothetical protein SAMCCGM7_Ch3024 [Sinorhizobium americanum CCGM7]APG92413.1 hypothetical protein SAMCFNEI73_Ch3149 [Sinorhizobium americanum]